MGDRNELWHVGSYSDMKWIRRAAEDSESKVVLGEILCLDYVFFVQ